MQCCSDPPFKAKPGAGSSALEVPSSLRDRAPRQQARMRSLAQGPQQLHFYSCFLQLSIYLLIREETKLLVPAPCQKAR